MIITALRDTYVYTTPYEVDAACAPIARGERLEVVDYLPHNLWGSIRIWVGRACYYTDPTHWELPERSIVPAAMEIIRKDYRPTAYCKYGDDWVLGYGARLIAPFRPVLPGMTCTPEQAELWLTRDLRQVVRELRRLVRVPLDDNQFSALVSLAHDISVPAFRNSRLLRLVNEAGYPTALVEMHAWVYHEGFVDEHLIWRRMAEKQLWLTPITPNTYVL